MPASLADRTRLAGHKQRSSNLVKFCIPSTSLVSVVNHMATRPGLLEEKKLSLSFH